MEGAIGKGVAQDVVQFNNSPATKSATYFSSRVAGVVATGMPRFIGKAGTRPVLNVTNTSIALNFAQSFWSIENLEIQQNGASGNATTISGNSIQCASMKISDAGANGFGYTGGSGASGRVFASEVSGVTGIGISLGSSQGWCFGNYAHDNTSDGISVTAIANDVRFCISDSNGGRGIYINQAAATGNATPVTVSNNAVYLNNSNGFEASDVDALVYFFNNIFQDNGDSGSEYNCVFATGAIENFGVHGFNCFFQGAARGGALNVLNMTVNSTQLPYILQASEITTDPLFTNPGAGDFSLGSTSPCKATGFPGQILGSNLGYLDMGPIQRQESGGGLMTHPGMVGGIRG